ncbi:chemotaxis protein CheB [Rhodothermus sp. AH-315-K08]|nr:chemotaxis protein CheB [Rhodothermus sp. AH-315-K08]
MRVLIAEDDNVSRLVLTKILDKAGYETVSARDGLEALDAIQSQHFDVLMTDWMMPNMDGIELTNKVREILDPPPVIIFVTTVTSPGAKEHALSAGADDYVVKPYNHREVIERLANLLKRRDQPAPERPVVRGAVGVRPPFVGVFIASSTGGPRALPGVIRTIDLGQEAALFIVQHGPDWVLESLADRLQEETNSPFRMAQDGETANAGTMYLAPGDAHLTIQPGSLRMTLGHGPLVNFLRPAADPLFESGARAFGRHNVGAVLTGMGRDGSEGSVHLMEAGGSIVVQNPDRATAPGMPSSAIKIKAASEVVELGEVGAAMTRRIQAATAALRLA